MMVNEIMVNLKSRKVVIQYAGMCNMSLLDTKNDIHLEKKWECFTKGGPTKSTGDQQNGGFSWSLMCRN